MSQKRERAEKAGRGGEEEAARWLEGEGWEILARRRKTKLGEIDLVASRDGLIAFVEEEHLLNVRFDLLPAGMLAWFLVGGVALGLAGSALSVRRHLQD